MLKRHRICFAILALQLSACGAVDTVRSKAAEIREEKEAQRFEVARSLCSRYGFKPETEAFSQCLQTEVNQIKNREAIEAQTRETRDAIRSTSPR